MANNAYLSSNLLFSYPSRQWHKLSLAKQYTLASSALVVLGMLALGGWVSNIIETIVTENAAVATARYMDNFVQPHLQALPSANVLPPDSSEALDDVMETAAVHMRVSAIRIWAHDNTLVYSTRKDEIGKTLAPKESLNAAWHGKISAEFDHPHIEEHDKDHANHTPQLEVYSPIRSSAGMIIAVAEFYENAEELRQALIQAREQSWIVTGLVTILMIAGLFWIVARGSTTIERQQLSLQERVEQLFQLLAQNEDLRNRLQASAHRTTELNERYLRQLGSDLHDGPAQMLSLALLRLDVLKPRNAEVDDEAKKRSKAHSAIKSVLSDALKEIRGICSGLTLPEIEKLSPRSALLSAVRAHERRTLTSVSIDICDLPNDMDHATKTCLYRFIQEGLNNAFRHARGMGQQVSVRSDGVLITVEVADQGPGIESRGKHLSEIHHLGLTGLRDRIEILGGSLHVSSWPNKGTRLTTRLPIQPTGEAYG